MRCRNVVSGLLVLLVAGAWLLLLGVSVQLVPNKRLIGTFQADLVAVFFWGSLALSLLLSLYIAMIVWGHRYTTHVRAQQHQSDQVAHRRFLSRLDHEMKNPLAIIRVGLLNLQQSNDMTNRQTDSIIHVSQQFQRLQKLLEDLRYLTELEQHALQPVAVNLREVLEEAVALTSPDNRHLELKIQQIPWPLSLVSGDSNLLLVVFCNVLDNAFKYTLPDDHIEVCASEDGQHALIEVADTGVGISFDESESVFEDLYRGKNVGTITGSGLGLPMVQRIVALHNGTIELHSRLGQGTLLKIRLPLVKERDV